MKFQLFDRKNMKYDLMSGTLSDEEFAELYTHAVDVCQDMLYMRDYSAATYQKCEKSLNLLKENS